MIGFQVDWNTQVKWIRQKIYFWNFELRNWWTLVQKLEYWTGFVLQKNEFFCLYKVYILSMSFHLFYLTHPST